MLLSLFMTTSDLSDQTKPWESAIQVSDLLYAEFFAQGDQVNMHLYAFVPSVLMFDVTSFALFNCLAARICKYYFITFL